LGASIGEICVLRDLAWKDTWTVSICAGSGKPEPIATFPEKERACSYALEVRQRRLESGQDLTVHLPDDCPCYCNPKK